MGIPHAAPDGRSWRRLEAAVVDFLRRPGLRGPYQRHGWHLTRVCKKCVQAFVEQNRPWRCAVCLNFQEIICFPKETKNPKKTWTRVCHSSVAVRRCGRCGLDRNADMYSERMWRQGKKTGHCKLCLWQRGVKPCPVVRVSFARARAA